MADEKKQQDQKPLEQERRPIREGGDGDFGEKRHKGDESTVVADERDTVIKRDD